MASAPSKQTFRNVVAGAIGNVLEWYDFAVYGFLAPILGAQFFPVEDPVASLLGAFSVFAIGYAARPIGGVLFGYFGDKIGRKPVLIMSVGLMGLATFGIGVLPDHAQLGAAAAVLLIVLRILQGLSVGGEFTGSIVFVAEHATPERRGYITSWPQFGCLVGFLLGSGVGALTSTVFGEHIMHAWGWRIPFLLGAVLAICGIAFRRHMTESPVMSDMKERTGSPLLVALRDYWKSILRLVGLLLIGGVGFYAVFVYAASYLTEQMHVSTAHALDINTLGLLVMLAVTPVAAYLSDRVGRKPLLYFLSIGTFVLAWLLWWLMHQEEFALILAGQIGFAVLFGAGFAVLPATMVEMLPAPVRCTGIAIGYNCCIGIFGGTTPLIATYLVVRTANDFAPAYYMMATAALSFIILLGLPETSRQPLR